MNFEWEWRPISNTNGRLMTQVVIRQSGDPIPFCDRLDVGSAQSRKRTSNRIRERFSDLSQSEVALELESIAEESRGLKAMTEDSQDALQRGSHIDEQLIVELAWNTLLAEPDFITYNRNTRCIERGREVKTTAGMIAVPECSKGLVTPGSPISGSVLVPTEADEGGEDETALRLDIERFVNSYLELPTGLQPLLVEYVLLSWVHDAFSELPYLAFRTADMGRGKSRGLEVAAALCYRPLIVGGGSSAAATLRMIDMYGGTLVADEFDQHESELGSEIGRILNQGFQTRRPLVKCDGESNAPRAFNCFGPKLFALRSRLGDDATESRTISIHMKQRTRSDIPISLPREVFDSEALIIRNRLLHWRFVSIGQIRLDPDLADRSLEDRANQIGLPLLAVASSDQAIQAIKSALRQQQTSVAADRADTVAGEVFRAIIKLATEPNDVVRPRDVAAEVNRGRAIQAGIEIEKLKRTMTAQRAGRLLRNELELPQEMRDNVGVRYRLAPDRIAQLCLRFGQELPAVFVRARGRSQEPTQVTPTPKNLPQASASGVPVGSVSCVVSSEAHCSTNQTTQEPHLSQPSQSQRERHDGAQPAELHRGEGEAATR